MGLGVRFAWPFSDSVGNVPTSGPGRLCEFSRHTTRRRPSIRVEVNQPVRTAGTKHYVEAGDVYGRLTVVARDLSPPKRPHARFVCRCECGVLKSVFAVSLLSGSTRSCGCYHLEATRNAANKAAKTDGMVGRRFGKFVVLEQAPSRNGVFFAVLCDCGTRTTVSGRNLRRGRGTRCRGCSKRRYSETESLSKTRAYIVWRNMKTRCFDPTHKAYARYGGCGISVCPRWMDFRCFYADMGERPQGMWLGRVNNALGYSPENCRWETREEQANNKRNTVHLVVSQEAADLVAKSVGQSVPRQHLFRLLGIDKDGNASRHPAGKG